MNEHVFEARLGAAPAIRLFAIRRDRGFQPGLVGPAYMEFVAEGDRLLHAGAAPYPFGESLQVRPVDYPGGEARLGDDLLDFALRQELAVRDEGEAVAALGLIHVMRRDEKSHSVGREAVNLFPELPARLGIDARRRLVEEHQPGLMNQTGGERQALLQIGRAHVLTPVTATT